MGKVWVVPGLLLERHQTEAGERLAGSVETSWQRDHCTAYLRNPKNFTEKYNKIGSVETCWKRGHCSYLLRGWRNASLRVPFVKPPSSHRCGSPSRPQCDNLTKCWWTDDYSKLHPCDFSNRNAWIFCQLFCDCFACRGAIIDYLKGWTFEEMKDQRRILWILRWKLHCTFIPDIILLSTFTAYYLARLLPTTKLEP